jgi:maltose/moltooligosaccharide transporter
VAEIGAAIKVMPKPLWQLRLGLPVPVVRDVLLLAVRLAQHRAVGLGCHRRQQGALFRGRRLDGLVNGFYNIVTFASAFALVGLARKHGAKFVHSAALTLAAIGLFIFPHISNKYLLFVPMIGFGIAWASMMGVPYIIAVAVIPRSATASTWGSST